MKAIVFDRFGGTEVLHEAEVEVPQPGPGQV
ncbi:NADP-dependent oxidoreductase, partial [Streptomyces minutiscleroticus]